jgi:DNA-binding NarL/FixJ family response regulator
VVHSKPTMNIGIYLNIQVVRDAFPSRVLSLIEAQQGSVMRQTISADPEKVFTKAELVILYLVSRGLSNYEVASRVGLAESTVKNKLSDMYKRLKVRSRAEAVAYGVGIGLLKVLDRTDPTATSAAEVVEAFLHGGPEVLR